MKPTNVMQILSEIRDQEPTAAEIEQAAARVRQRLFPAAQAQTAHPGAIRSCVGFTELFPAAIAGSLDASRQILLDAHVRECLDCRRGIDRLRRSVHDGAATRVTAM